LFVVDNLSSLAMPANKLPRPGKLPTHQQKVSPLFVETWAAAPAIFIVETPASASIAINFSSQCSNLQQPAATGSCALKMQSQGDLAALWGPVAPDFVLSTAGVTICWLLHILQFLILIVIIVLVLSY